MVIFLQFTVCDLRSLAGLEDQLLAKPNWNSVVEYRDFVTGSGQIVNRTKGGLPNWVGENKICKINKGIYNIPQIILSDKKKLKCVEKHHYSDGMFLHKYEFVFLMEGIKKRHSIINRKVYDYHYLREIVERVVQCEIRVRNRLYKYNRTNFNNPKQSILEFHLTGTTRNKFLDQQDGGHLVVGIPQILFQIRTYDVCKTLPIQVIKASSEVKNPPVHLQGWIDKICNNPYRFWLLRDKLNPRISKAARNTRIACMRIHSELECIRHTCSFLDREEIAPFSPQSDLAQKFFHESTRRISKSESSLNKSCKVSKIDRFSKQIMDVLSSGELSRQYHRVKYLQQMRRNLERKMVNVYQVHFGQGDNVSGDKVQN